MSLVAELQRRRVFRALVGYGIASFAVLQIIEPIMHGLHWPDAVLSYTVVALAVGFPIVVSLAWIFDVNAGRIERTLPTGSGLKGARLAFLLMGIGVLAATPGVAWYLFMRTPVQPALAPASGATAATPSIAVLPFVNLSSDKEQEYFADGLAEELLNLLSKVPGLHVAARTSAFSFKGRNEDVIEIGQKLHVATVLEGSVRRSGDQIRITTQLINASDGYHLWSETYDRKLTDIFAVQDEIAKAVVHGLKIKLLPGQAPSADEHRTASTEAYLHYLEGRNLLATLTGDDWQRAQATFQQAVDLDPNFAPAWAGLGYTRSFVGIGNAQATMQALAEVDRSIALAPRLAEAFAMRGTVRLRNQFDWDGARADFERALALNPVDPFALEQYGYFLQGWRGQLREAAETLQKAIERDPLNPRLIHNLGSVYLFSGDLAAARKVFEREAEIRSGTKGASSPSIAGDSSPIYLLLLEGKPAQALELSNRFSMEAWRLMGVALAQHALGHEQESRRALAALGAPHLAFGFSVQVAQVHAFLGEKDKAFEWLDRAYANHDPGMMRLKVDPLLRMLGGDPRYAALLKKMKLPLN